MIKKIKKNIKGIYHDIFKYVFIPPFWMKPLEDDICWYNNVEPVAHALGTIDGVNYTNSKEAFQNSINRNVRYFETDVIFTKDGIPVLSHEIDPDTNFETFINTKIKDKYTPLSLSNFIEYMDKNPNISVMFDIKGSDAKKLAQWLKENALRHKERFSIQVGYKKDFKEIIKIYPFQIHWNFSIDGNVNYRLAFLVKNNIKTASVSINQIKSAKTLHYLNKFNIKPIVYTVNSKEIADKMLSWGCKGYITDNLFY